MECLEGRKMMFRGSQGIQMTYCGIWKMFETFACKPAALKITNGLDGPYSTLVSTSLSNGEAYYMPKETGLTLCPAVRYSKHNLYDLIDKQKTVKIDSYEALLDYWLHFTKVVAHLQVMSQLSSIQKDDLFLEGFDQEFQKISRGFERPSMKLGYKSQRPRGLRSNVKGWRDADSLKLLKVPGESSRSQALKVDGIEVAMAELSSSPLVEGRCKSSFNHIEVTLYIAEEPLTVRLQGDCLQGKLEEQSKEKLLGAKASVELKATEASGDSPVPQSEYLHPSSSSHADILPQNPPIEPQDAQDEPRTDE
ncbi:hypothetical protein F5141DRAFT_1067115 [Pisolithus sp. B1]|nr:hypothetical protein F5141DRAFT_1067115 [Pisolithus sp. B1]